MWFKTTTVLKVHSKTYIKIENFTSQEFCGECSAEKVQQRKDCRVESSAVWSTTVWSHLHLPKLHSMAFSSMDTVLSQSTSHTLESLPKRATLVKPLRPEPHLIATCLLKAPTSQITAEEIRKWLAEKYPHYRYTKR